MKTHFVHQLIHDKCGTSHVARVLHIGYEEIEDENLWQENDNRTDTAYHAIYQHSLQRTIGHGSRNNLAQPGDTRLYPVHGILPYIECHAEHHKKKEQEDGKTEIAVRDEAIYHVGCAIGILVMARLITRLFQGTMDKTIFGIHDSRFTVFPSFLLHALLRLVTMGDNLLGIGESGNISFHILIMLQKLDGQITGRIPLTQIVLLFQVLLHLLDAMLQLVPVVDMYVAIVALAVLLPFIHVYHHLEELFNASSVSEHRRHHRHTEQLA